MIPNRSVMMRTTRSSGDRLGHRDHRTRSRTRLRDMRVLGTGSALLILVGCTDVPEVAQSAAPGDLGPADARATEGFTSIFDAAELPDGRVVITDNRESAIAVIDFEEGDVTRLGRRGSGPLEFQSAFTILPFPGDTLAVYDSRGQRFTLIDRDGRITGT